MVARSERDEGCGETVCELCADCVRTVDGGSAFGPGYWGFPCARHANGDVAIKVRCGSVRTAQWHPPYSGVRTVPLSCTVFHPIPRCGFPSLTFTARSLVLSVSRSLPCGACAEPAHSPIRPHTRASVRPCVPHTQQQVRHTHGVTTLSLGAHGPQPQPPLTLCKYKQRAAEPAERSSIKCVCVSV